MDGDTSVTGIEMLVTLVDQLCAAAPTVVVLDDLQWADDASLIIWHQLAASIGQLRLLLIGICRPAPHRPAVQELRAALREYASRAAHGAARRGGTGTRGHGARMP